MLNYTGNQVYMKIEKEQFEYVVAKIQEIYTFNPEDQDQLIRYRELIKNIILMWEKAKEIDLTQIGEQ